MAVGMDYKAYVRRTGRQPDHLYDQEVKAYRKVSNRKWRKRTRLMVKRRDVDWECAILPLPPKTGGCLTT